MEMKFWYLRDDDKAVLTKGMETAVICNALRYVAREEHLPPLPTGQDGLRWVEEQINHARRYGALEQNSFSRWLTIALLGGSDFWLQDEVKDILNHTAPTQEKLGLLEKLAALNLKPFTRREAVNKDSTESIVYRLCEAGLPLWVIVDNALDASIQGMADALEVAHYSLFRPADQALEGRGPWLVAAWTKPRLVQYILSRPDYGINALWLVADITDPDELISHLQGLMYVKEDGEMKNRFRFYDPRVFNHWINNLAPVRLADFFGPVQQWISPDPNPLMTEQRVWQYKLNEKGLECHALAEPSASAIAS